MNIKMKTNTFVQLFTEHLNENKNWKFYNILNSDEAANESYEEEEIKENREVPQCHIELGAGKTGLNASRHGPSRGRANPAHLNRRGVPSRRSDESEPISSADRRGHTPRSTGATGGSRPSTMLEARAGRSIA